MATILTPLSIIRYLQKFLFCSEIFRWVNILKFDFVFIALRPIFMILSHLWLYFWINPASVDRHIYASVLKVVIFFNVIKLNMPPLPSPITKLCRKSTNDLVKTTYFSVLSFRICPITEYHISQHFWNKMLYFCLEKVCQKTVCTIQISQTID